MDQQTPIVLDISLFVNSTRMTQVCAQSGYYTSITTAIQSCISLTNDATSQLIHVLITTRFDFATVSMRQYHVIKPHLSYTI